MIPSDGGGGQSAGRTVPGDYSGRRAVRHFVGERFVWPGVFLLYFFSRLIQPFLIDTFMTGINSRHQHIPSSAQFFQIL